MAIKNKKVDFFPTELFCELQKTTQWITAEELRDMFQQKVRDPNPVPGKYVICTASLPLKFKKALSAQAFSVIYYDEKGLWNVKEERTSFPIAYGLRQKLGTDKAFVVPSSFGYVVSRYPWTVDNFGVVNNALVFMDMCVPMFAFCF